MTRSNGFIRTLEHATMRVVLFLFQGKINRRAKTPEPIGPQRVLICKWCCMGDAIVSLYAIREFKRRSPDTVIDMLVSSRIAEVYRQAPFIRNVHVLPLTGKRLTLELINPWLWVRLVALVRKLRRTCYTQFIDLELYRGTGPVLKRVIGIPFSRGFQVEGALPKHHDFEVPLPRHLPEWQCCYQVLALPVPSQLPKPLFEKKTVSPSSTTQSVRIAPESGRRIGIVFGSSFNWPQKQWPGLHFSELITLLAKDGHEFILFGARDESTAGAEIAAKAIGKVTDTTGRLEYSALHKEVSSCDLVVGNDTGTMHLAAAFGIPTVTLFGPTDPRKWNPMTSTAIYLKEIPCRPCYYLGSMPACSHFSCLRQMQPSMVAEQVRQVLAEIVH